MRIDSQVEALDFLFYQNSVYKVILASSVFNGWTDKEVDLGTITQFVRLLSGSALTGTVYI